MRLLVDTQLLIWAGREPAKLSEAARFYLRDAGHELLFSAATIWEIAMKSGLRKPGFSIESARFLAGLRRSDYAELPVTSAHGAAIEQLPAIHKDPFDRILVAQAAVEKIALLTADPIVARYPESILKV